MVPSNPAPFTGSQSLQSFLELISAGAPDPGRLEPVLARLEQERRLEHAWYLLKQAHLDPALWGGLQARLRARVDQGRDRRMDDWPGDPHRRTLRLRFQVGAPASAQHPAGLLALLVRTLMAAGLPVALGLEKTPRPVAHLGHPLPPLVGGLCEWADVGLLEPVPVQGLPTRINAQAPPGLRVEQCLEVPNYASPVAELCRWALWRWHCPAEELPEAREKLAIFLASDRFEMEKSGRVGDRKGLKRVDIRPMVADAQWRGPDLYLHTPIRPGEATNPRKLLGAILGLPVPEQDLVRLQVELGEDPRLAQADKYQPKLHNMFEDAVALGSGGNIRIVDEDEDEPLIL